MIPVDTVTQPQLMEWLNIFTEFSIVPAVEYVADDSLCTSTQSPGFPIEQLRAELADAEDVYDIEDIFLIRGHINVYNTHATIARTSSQENAQQLVALLRTTKQMLQYQKEYAR